MPVGPSSVLHCPTPEQACGFESEAIAPAIDDAELQTFEAGAVQVYLHDTMYPEDAAGLAPIAESQGLIAARQRAAFDCAKQILAGQCRFYKYASAEGIYQLVPNLPLVK